MSFFFTKERLFKISMLRVAYLTAFVACFFFTEIGRKIYRPFIYRNHIDDWGVADSIGNSFGTFTIIFLYLGLFHPTRTQSYRIIGFITVGLILYEALQTILPRGTLDIKDVIATLGAGIFAAIIVTLIHYFRPEHPDKSAGTGVDA